MTGEIKCVGDSTIFVDGHTNPELRNTPVSQLRFETNEVVAEITLTRENLMELRHALEDLTNVPIRYVVCREGVRDELPGRTIEVGALEIDPNKHGYIPVVYDYETEHLIGTARLFERESKDDGTADLSFEIEFFEDRIMEKVKDLPVGVYATRVVETLNSDDPEQKVVTSAVVKEISFYRPFELKNTPVDLI